MLIGQALFIYIFKLNHVYHYDVSLVDFAVNLEAYYLLIFHSI